MCVEANPTELDRIHAFSVKWQYVMMVEKETIINLVVYFKQEREMKVIQGANEHKQTEREKQRNRKRGEGDTSTHREKQRNRKRGERDTLTERGTE